MDDRGRSWSQSGQATEPDLTPLCRKKVVRAAASPPPGRPPPPPPLPFPGRSPLQQMAQRIARNREVLGLHFPSDSKAGMLLAEETFKILMKCKSINDPNDGLIAKASAEWWP